MRIGTVLVSGPSMVPTLYDGDWLLVRRTRDARPGQVVVGRYRSKPDVLAVKRAVRQDDGWTVASDNAFAPAPEGAFDVEAVVVLRFWPLSRAGALPRPSR